MSNYKALPYTALHAGITYHRPPQILPDIVYADSPATDVMTDFTKVSAITMGPCATIDAANERMKSSGVRLLMVTDQNNNIMGILTYADLTGERPMKYLQEHGGKREDIYLRDIMTAQDKIDVLHMVDVANAKVGDIVETLKQAGRRHALVVDLDNDKKQQVRGLFSVKQISRQLGMDLETSEVAKTFAELEAVIG